MLARPLFDAAATAFGQVLLDMFKTWRTTEDARRFGRAEAERDAALAASHALRDFEAVPLPSRDETLTALRRGEG
jgi:hypothetical protein